MVKIWYIETTETQTCSLLYQCFFQHVIFIPKDNQCKKHSRSGWMGL